MRDGKTFWLSSGNWQSSNQPDVHPFDDAPGPLPPSFQRKYNRDYHAIIENDTLSSAYETYIKRDYELTAAAAAPESFALPDLFVPEEEEEAVEFAEPPQLFKPLRLERQFKVQPLLTPDNYAENALKLIQSAKQSVLFQNQYINFRNTGEDFPIFKRLIGALKSQIDKGLDVRIICRDMMKEESVDVLVVLGFPRECMKFQPACHNKTIIVDGKIVMFGSHNWSNEGVVTNRDASLIFYDDEIAAYLARVYEYDWERLATAKPTPRTCSRGPRRRKDTARLQTRAVFRGLRRLNARPGGKVNGQRGKYYKSVRHIDGNEVGRPGASMAQNRSSEGGGGNAITVAAGNTRPDRSSPDGPAVVVSAPDAVANCGLESGGSEQREAASPSPGPIGPPATPQWPPARTPRRQSPGDVVVHVEVIRGGYTNVKVPVAICPRYEGMALAGPAKEFDRQIDSWLTRAVDLGMIGSGLGQLFTVNLQRSRDAGRVNVDVLLMVGMGQPGDFAADDLRYLMSNVTIAVKSMGHDEFSTMLIGTGRNELSIGQAVRGFLEGIIDGYERFRVIADAVTFHRDRLQQSAEHLSSSRLSKVTRKRPRVFSRSSRRWPRRDRFRGSIWSLPAETTWISDPPDDPNSTDVEPYVPVTLLRVTKSSSSPHRDIRGEFRSCRSYRHRGL